MNITKCKIKLSLKFHQGKDVNFCLLQHTLINEDDHRFNGLFEQMSGIVCAMLSHYNGFQDYQQIIDNRNHDLFGRGSDFFGGAILVLIQTGKMGWQHTRYSLAW